MKKLAAILLGKSISKTTRLLKIGGGHAAPGLYALKVDPSLIEKLIEKSAKNIIITGTNGKTTTSKIIADVLTASGFKVVRNSTGSNLERGIASALIKSSSIMGKVKYDFGVWECDEFAFNLLAPKIKPDIIVFLNVFRDQLDRYGEVNTIVSRWQETLSKLKETTLIINNDDTSLKSLGKGSKVVTFGIKNSKITGEGKTKTKIQADFEAEILDSKNLSGTDFKVKFAEEEEKFHLPLPGIYNVYNFLASFALSRVLNIPTEALNVSLKDFSPAFGRFESFPVPGKEKSAKASIFLIKNPVGASETLKTISPHIHFGDSILLALNDNIADGKDVSWIWDAKFEELVSAKSKAKIFISGTRCYDLALRLKYAGIGESNFEIVPDISEALDKSMSACKLKLFILPTYTALLEIQDLLVKKKVKQEYWKE